VGVDSAWEQKNLKAKSLSKYDLCALNPFPDLNGAFGEGVRRMGGTNAGFVGRRYYFLPLTKRESFLALLWL